MSIDSYHEYPKEKHEKTITEYIEEYRWDIEELEKLRMILEMILDILNRFLPELVTRLKDWCEWADTISRMIPSHWRNVYESVREKTPLEEWLEKYGLKRWWYTIYYTEHT